MTPLHKLSLLSLLYLAEGLPFGFQVMALPMILRQQGTSLKAIGFATALSLPWMLKAGFAPVVERFGRRKAWIVPLLSLLVMSCLAGAWILHTWGVKDGLRALLFVVFFQNLFAATLDIAVDGLAVDLLGPDELGIGNSAQVAGYKVGMLGSGGLLMWISGSLGGWPVLFALMSAVLVTTLVGVLALLREEPPPSKEATDTRESLGGLLRTLGQAVVVPQGGWLLVYLATYKLGETLLSGMWKPWLTDKGVTMEQFGLWVGTYGLIVSTIGSFLGGIAAMRLGLWRAMALFALLRSASLLAPFAVAADLVPGGSFAARVIVATCVEELCAGALTTATFAFMMSRTDRRIGAAHFTLLASIEVWGKGMMGFMSGVITEQLGYVPAFGVAVAVSFGLLPLLLPLRTAPAEPPA